MIDQGLLASLFVVAVGVWVIARGVRPACADPEDLLDLLSVPVMVGVIGARLTAVALDDPSAFSRPADLLLVRGGMDLWAGIVAGAAALSVALHRRGDESVVASVAQLSPYAIWGIALYEGTCLVREGCFGPVSAVGITPAGASSRHLPVGLALGASLVILGVLVRRLACLDSLLAIATAVGGLGAARAVAAIWLPRISEGLSRQHAESLVVLAMALVVGTARLVVVARSRCTRRLPTPTRSSRTEGHWVKRRSSPLREEEPPCS